MRFLSLILLFNIQFIAAQSVPEPLPPQGHSLYIMDFDINPDGKSYVTVGIDRKMIAWDIKTGVPFESKKVHRAEIYSVRYDWMGDTIVTASPDSTVKLWRSEDLSLIHTIHTGVQNAYAESGRFNKKIVVAGNDGSFIIYDKHTFKKLHKIKAHEGRVNCAVFSTNGALVFSGGEDGWVYGYDYTSGKKLFELDTKSPVKNITFDMFNTAMVIHTMNGRAEILLVPSFKGYGAVPVQTKEYFGNINFVSQIDISPDNNWFAYADSTRSVFIADAKTKEARGYQTPHSDFISKVKFSFDMKYLLSLDHDQNMVIAALHNFDFEKSKQMPVRIAKQYSDNPRRLYFTNFNELCIRGFYAYKWNLVNGSMETLPITLNYENHLKSLLPHAKIDAIDLWLDVEQDIVLIQEKNDEHFKDPKNYTFNRDRSKLWMQIGDQFYIVNTSTLQIEQQGKYKEDEKLEQVLFEGNQVFIAINDALTCFEIDNGKMKKTWSQEIKGFVHFDVKNGVVAVGTTDFYLHFLEADSGKTTTKWTGNLGAYQRVQFHPTENRLATTSFEGTLTIWDLASQKERFFAKFNNTDIHDITFSKKGRMIALIGNDNMIRVYDLKENNAPPSFEIYTMKEKGMVAINQDAYYQSTKNAHQNLAYKYNGNIYSCQQFDAMYNRPDLVLQDSPYADEWYVDMLTKAYEKRVDKLSDKPAIAENQNFPEAAIANKDAFPNIIEENTVTLNLTASDSTEGLASINLYINNVPYFGKNGKQINGLNYNQSLDIELPSGNNNIRWVVKNTNGAESLFDEIDLNVITEQKPNLYIASIGVANYKDERFTLDYPAKDAEDVINKFEKSKTYDKIHAKLLVNEKVTKDKIFALRSFFEQAGPNDVVMLFVAGHGLLDEELSYYFATYDIDFNAPEKNGLAYAALEDLLDGLSALKKVLLMDTCHSGEVDEEEVEMTAQVETVEGDIQFRTAGAGVREKEGVGTVKASELAKELFADMRDGAGVTVISSAGGAEYAMESGEWKNGLFTYCLLQGLKSRNADLDTDGKITISEMQWYIKDRVTKLSEGKQVPTYRTENIEMDFELF